MKKSILAAGAASVALAAMPIVGAMAVDFTDTIKVNIADTCEFTRDTTTPHPAVASESWNPTGTTTDTLTAVTVPLNKETEIARSKFHVVCNDVDGYQVTVAASVLEKPATTTPVSAVATMAYNNATSGTAGTWRLTSDGVGQNIGTGDKVIYENTTTPGRDFTIAYYVQPAAAQAAGTYTGTAAYTFATLPVSGS